MTNQRILGVFVCGLAGAGVGAVWFSQTLYSQEVPAQAAPAELTYAAWAEPLDPLETEGPIAVCFDAHNPPSSEFMEDMMAALDEVGRLPAGGDAEYQLTGRWSGSQGNPRNLRWSFIPDGVSIPNGIGEGTSNNRLFEALDAQYAGQGGRATWVLRFEQSFNRWAEVSGLTYTRIKFNNNDWDDGASFGSAGADGLRGDVRICAKTIDGGNGVLAYNNFPSGGGDMVLDRQENWGSSSSLNRFLRNVVMHEHGHGTGLLHTCSNNSQIIMEPFIDTSYDGLRHDDVRANQRHYGDPQEPDNSAADATDIGTPTPGLTFSSFCNLPPPVSGGNPSQTSRCSIDADAEQDWFRFTVAGPSTLDVTLTPLGFTYQNAAQNFNGSCPGGTSPSLNTLTVANLSVSVVGTNGTTVLASAESAAAGTAETLNDVVLPTAGSYYIRVFESGSLSESQLYTFSLLVTQTAEPCPEDLSGDGTVGQDDLNILLAQFGCVSACTADLTGDGVVDQQDLNVLLAAFGACP